MLTPAPALLIPAIRGHAPNRRRKPSILTRPTVNTWLRSGRAGLLAIGLVGLAACGKAGDWRQTQTASAESDAESAYVRPPEVRAAERAPDGGVILSGRAEPNSRVRLSSPDGGANGGTVTANGVWSMPTAPGGGIYGLSEDLGGRVVQGEGYIVTLPPPGRAAALLRAGGGARVLGGGQAGVRIAVADFDGEGGAVISGFAPAGAGLRLAVDGAAAPGEVKADSQGRFFIAAPSVLKRGVHQIRVQSGALASQADIAVEPAGPISGRPYRAVRQDHAWRVDWITPGGGPQTSVILDPP